MIACPSGPGCASTKEIAGASTEQRTDCTLLGSQLHSYVCSQVKSTAA